VAYLSGDALRVVAGDGTGDHLLAAGVARVAPAWRPGHAFQLASFQLAYLTATGRLVVRDGDTGLTAWSARPAVNVRELAWSEDGQRLLVLSPRKVLLYDATGRLVWTLSASNASPILHGAMSPDGRKLALVSGGTTGEVTIVDQRARTPVARRVLAGSGLGQVDWAPDGRWLVVAWPAANQWVFVRVVGAPRISAVSRIAQQFSGGSTVTFPRLEGWCCSAASTAG
jgi:Tol biopolymer transport system component